MNVSVSTRVAHTTTQPAGTAAADLRTSVARLHQGRAHLRGTIIGGADLAGEKDDDALRGTAMGVADLAGETDDDAAAKDDDDADGGTKWHKTGSRYDTIDAGAQAARAIIAARTPVPAPSQAPCCTEAQLMAQAQAQGGEGV